MELSVCAKASKGPKLYNTLTLLLCLVLYCYDMSYQTKPFAKLKILRNINIFWKIGIALYLCTWLVDWLVATGGLTLRLLWPLKSFLLSPGRRDGIDDIDDIDETNETLNLLRTFWRLYEDFLRPSEDLLMTFWGLCKYLLGTFWGNSENFWLPSKDFFKTFGIFFEKVQVFLRTFCVLSEDFPQFFEDFLRTFWGLLRT